MRFDPCFDPFLAVSREGDRSDRHGVTECYPLQTHEMLFDALTQAFRVLGGVPRRGIFDNMKTAVDKVGTGKARQVNARFAALASHYPRNRER